MTAETVLLFLGGLVLLLVGAEVLVRGASRLAAALGISPVVVGLTVVALGTSAPEVAVSVASSLEGRGDLAVGNVFGSNVFNVFVVLGASALLVPLVVAQKLVRVDVPLMIGAAALVGLFALDGRLGRVEGVVLLAGLGAYLLFTLLAARKTPPDVAAEYAQEFGTAPPRGWKVTLFCLGLVVAGLAGLVVGSELLVDSAGRAARAFGVSELVVGITLVSVGTSLPEVATSLVAAWRGERDIAVGNVVGSNLFNLLGVLGAAALVAGEGVTLSPAAVQLDLPVMLAACLLCLPVFFTGLRVDRREGLLFLAYYGLYLAFLVLRATGSSALSTFGEVVLVLLPLTFVALLLPVIAARRERRSRRP